jgi:hypothetical protein
VKTFRVPVGLTQYTVKLRKRVRHTDGDVCKGLCDFNTKTITVDANQDHDAQVRTFFHEYLHAVFTELGYDELSDDESLVEALSMDLVRLMRALPEEFK